MDVGGVIVGVLVVLGADCDEAYESTLAVIAQSPLEFSVRHCL
jgi:hypothetical protein